MPWLKLLHIGAVIVWCGALLYLPAAIAAAARQNARVQALPASLPLRFLFTGVALLLLGSPAGLHQLPLPGGRASSPIMRVEAIGRQWSWELRYDDGEVRAINELRLPVGRPVDIVTGSVDVIHSFWVPRLGGKLDAISRSSPGRCWSRRR